MAKSLNASWASANWVWAFASASAKYVLRASLASLTRSAIFLALSETPPIAVSTSSMAGGSGVNDPPKVRLLSTADLVAFL